MNKKDIEIDTIKVYPITKKRKWRTTDTAKELGKLMKELSKMLQPHYYAKKKKKQQFVRAANPQKQPCMAKMYYGDKKENHLNFLRVYMPQNNKQEVTDKPRLFNSITDSVSEEELLQYEKIASDRYFKWIISPESQKIPLKNLVRAFVQVLENETGYKFTWLAAEHHDTEHQHAHLLLNGIDRQTGKKINKIPPEILKNARLKAGEICTQIIGPRSAEQIRISKERLPEARRYCQLDDIIVSHCRQFTETEKRNNNEYEAQIVARNDEMLRRLNTLKIMGLAECINTEKPPVFILEKNWTKKLKNISRYNTFIDARNKLRYSLAGDLQLYDTNTDRIRGTITNRYDMNDEDVWNNAIVVENKSEKRAYYVPLFKKIDIEVGDFVEITPPEKGKGKTLPKIRIIKNRTNDKNKKL